MTFRFADATKEQKLERIRAVIEEYIVPQLAFDGGGVQVIDLVESTVVIAYSGACACCPMALSGTLSMIQETLVEHVDSTIVVKPTFSSRGCCS